MKKVLIAIAAIVFSALASAQSYQDTVRDDKFCSSAGELAQIVYDGKINGGISKQYFADGINSSSFPERNKMIFQLAINYAADRATSDKDAYMGAWAACMDFQNPQ